MSTSVVNNSDLMKHLSAAHTSTQLTLDKNSVADAVDDDSSPGVTNVTQTELNAMIDRYVVENTRLLSSADSDSFRASLVKYQVTVKERHFLNTYVDAE